MLVLAKENVSFKNIYSIGQKLMKSFGIIKKTHWIISSKLITLYRNIFCKLFIRIKNLKNMEFIKLYAFLLKIWNT